MVFWDCLQSWPKKFVLGCVIPPAGTVARSRNLGHTCLAHPVYRTNLFLLILLDETVSQLDKTVFRILAFSFRILREFLSDSAVPEFER